MEIWPSLDPQSAVPIYRQLGAYLQRLIETGDLRSGDRLPPTRELAGQLGLNRTTISAAYELLESAGLIKGEVGRGSYVSGRQEPRAESLNWSRMLTTSVSTSAGSARHFVTSSAGPRLFRLPGGLAVSSVGICGKRVLHPPPTEWPPATTKRSVEAS